MVGHLRTSLTMLELHDEEDEEGHWLGNIWHLLIASNCIKSRANMVILSTPGFFE